MSLAVEIAQTIPVNTGREQAPAIATTRINNAQGAR